MRAPGGTGVVLSRSCPPSSCGSLFAKAGRHPYVGLSRKHVRVNPAKGHQLSTGSGVRMGNSDAFGQLASLLLDNLPGELGHRRAAKCGRKANKVMILH